MPLAKKLTKVVWQFFSRRREQKLTTVGVKRGYLGASAVLINNISPLHQLGRLCH